MPGYTNQPVSALVDEAEYIDNIEREIQKQKYEAKIVQFEAGQPSIEEQLQKLKQEQDYGI